MDDEVIIYENKGNFWGFGGTFFMCLFMGMFFMSLGSHFSNPALDFALAVCGILMVMSFRKALHTEDTDHPVIRISKEGITDYQAFLNEGFYPWKQIRSVYVWNGHPGNTEAVALDLLRDPSDQPKTVYISIMKTKYPASKIVEMIKAYQTSHLYEMK